MTAEADRERPLNEGNGELVTVIVPTHYRNDMLEEAIGSVYQQEHRPIELIVVDDSGEGNAEPVVEEYDEVTYVPFSENRGAQAARNAGFERATGKYVQFLDDDDRLRSDKFVKQIRRFTDSTEVVYSGVEILETGEVISPKPHIRGSVLKSALLHTLWPCSYCTMLTKKSALDDVMPIEQHAADDVEAQIELAKRTEFDYVDEPLIYSRNQLDDALSYTPEYFEARLYLVSKYSHLYEQCPDRVERRVLSAIYRAKAEQIMESTDWSAEAIKSYGRSAYYARDRPLRIADFVLSIFGRRGLHFADQFRSFCRKYLT